MFCKLISYSLSGIDALPIQIEIDVHDGLPGFDIVGLPDNSVKESKERVKSAIKNSGYTFPMCHITVNLAPADRKKEGSLYDLPIALGLLCCFGELAPAQLESYIFIGELALDGDVRGVRGVLPLLCSIEDDSTTCIIPYHNLEEAALVHRVKTKLTNSLNETIKYITHQADLPSPHLSKQVKSSNNNTIDFSDVKGQYTAKRGLLISAAGYHNALLIGPPGSGKTMLAKRLPTILPPLSEQESIEVTKIYSIAQQLTEYQIIQRRPFRAPHHTISDIGLVGGGNCPKPGEISLAHLGVLFLDELLEFSKHALEVLRQPLEDHAITICRAQHHIQYPADFLFLASTNPCPCGYYPDFSRCTCSHSMVKRYLSKLSGPLIDRIDLHLEAQVPKLTELKENISFTSDSMLHQVIQVHNLQKKRYKNYSFQYNSQIPSHLISNFCPLSADAKLILEQWFNNNAPSVRAYDKIQKLARTIADLEDSPILEAHHIAEALNYRLLDRRL